METLKFNVDKQQMCIRDSPRDEQLQKLTSALGVEIDFFTRMEDIQYGRNQ